RRQRGSAKASAPAPLVSASVRRCRYPYRAGISLELLSLLSFALRRPGEVLRRAGEGVDVSLGPLVGRLQDDSISLAADEHGVGVEAELLRQADCLAAARPEPLGALGLRLRHA